MAKEKNLKKKIVVTGGGSGGHVSAALSIITSLQKEYLLNRENFLYIGGDLGMENEKPGNSIERKVFSKESFNQEFIRAGKLQRSISLKTLFLLFRTLLGFWDSYKIIKKFKPDIVISTGGFVTVPVCLISKIFKSKIYLHEQTAAVGLANKIVSKYADKIFITFPSSSNYFPENKTYHTGNLIKPDIFNKTGKGPIVEPFKKMLEKQEELPIIYISGGGLGSHSINMTVKEGLNSLLQDYQVILQTGDNQEYKDYEVLLQEKNKLDSSLRDRFLPVKYIGRNEIGYVLNNIDLFVGRAGANTVYEMGVLRIPSIFIPIPWVTHNEQEKNARILKDLGIADILNEGELTPEQLLLKIDRFYNKKKIYNEDEIARIFITNAEIKILKHLSI